MVTNINNKHKIDIYLETKQAIKFGKIIKQFTVLTFRKDRILVPENRLKVICHGIGLLIYWKIGSLYRLKTFNNRYLENLALSDCAILFMKRMNHVLS